MKMLSGVSFLWLQLAVAFTLLAANPVQAESYSSGGGANYSSGDYKSDISDSSNLVTGASALGASAGKGTKEEQVRELLKQLKAKNKISEQDEKLVLWNLVNKGADQAAAAIDKFKAKQLKDRQGDWEKQQSELSQVMETNVGQSASKVEQAFREAKGCGEFDKQVGQITQTVKGLDKAAQYTQQETGKVLGKKIEEAGKAAKELETKAIAEAIGLTGKDEQEAFKKAHALDLAAIQAGKDPAQPGAAEQILKGQQDEFKVKMGRLFALINGPGGLKEFNADLKKSDKEFAKVRGFATKFLKDTFGKSQGEMGKSLQVAEKACVENKAKLEKRASELKAQAKDYYAQQGVEQASAANDEAAQKVAKKLDQYASFAKGMKCSQISSQVAMLDAPLKDATGALNEKKSTNDFSIQFAKSTDQLGESVAKLAEQVAPTVQACGQAKSLFEDMEKYAAAFASDGKGKSGASGGESVARAGKKGGASGGAPSTINVGGGAHGI